MKFSPEKVLWEMRLSAGHVMPRGVYLPISNDSASTIEAFLIGQKCTPSVDLSHVR